MEVGEPKVYGTMNLFQVSVQTLKEISNILDCFGGLGSALIGGFCEV